MEKDNLSIRVRKLERWQDDTVLWQHSMVDWRTAVERQTVAIESMIKLFERIEGSLWLFVRIGNGLKWIAAIVAACSAAWFGLKGFIK